MNHKEKNIVSIWVVALFFYSCGKKTEECRPVRKDVTETVFASGSLEAGNAYNLTAQADGYLTQINFEEGDNVAVGTVLAIVDNKEAGVNEHSASELYNIAQQNLQIDAPVLQQALAAININKQKMELDLINSQRYQRLWDVNSVAKIDLENANLQYKTSFENYQSALENYNQLKQQAQQQVITTKATRKINAIITARNQIKAVVGGKVFKKYKQIGDYVRKGETIALLGFVENIYAKVNVDEGNIWKIRVGQDAFIQLNINKDKVYKGIVREICPAFDEASQSFICKLIFTDSLDFNIVNTQLQSNIVVSTTKSALLIPRNYLDFGGYVQIKGRKEKTKVQTKFVGTEWVQVLDAINDNTILITENLAVNRINSSDVGAQLQR